MMMHLTYNRQAILRILEERDGAGSGSANRG